MLTLPSKNRKVSSITTPILAGYFMLDGGAMFGVVPKSIWQRNNPATENNLTKWALRCLLLKYDDRLILLETGTGDKQSEQFFNFIHPEGDSLLVALKKAGYEPSQITDVFLTHLHFDHVGGATRWNEDKTKVVTTFPNAKYWIHKEHWASAMKPNPREKASYLTENLIPLEDSGQLNLITDGEHTLPFDIIVVNGHTQSQMLPLIETTKGTILYVADLFPSSSHIKPHYIPAYDVQPLKSMEEKQEIFRYCADEKIRMFFEHDTYIESGMPAYNMKGIFLDEVKQCPAIKA